MNSVVTDIVSIIQTAGLAPDALGVGIFEEGFSEDAATEAIAVTSSGGYDSEENSSHTMEQPTFQIIYQYRGDRSVLYTKIEAVMTAIKSARNTVVNGTQYVGFWEMQPPIYLGEDDKGRFQYAVNFRTMRHSA